MEVTSTQNTTTTQTTSSLDNQQNKSATSTFFKILKEKEINPKEITYEEYKKLTKEEIDTLYPKDTMPEENEKAHSLHLRVNGSDDEVLNKVLFEDALNSDDTEYDKSINGSIDARLKFWEEMEKFKIALEKTQQYIEDNNIQTSGNLTDAVVQFSKILTKIYKETVVPDEDKKITAQELFYSFELEESYYPTVMEYRNYTQDSDYYKKTREAIEYHNRIKDEYTKRIEENKALLNEYTNSTQQEEKTQESKKVEKEETKEVVEQTRTRRELVEDLISMLRTGFTVEELEYIEELLAEIKKRLKEEGASDKEGKLDKMLSELEQAVAELQKRVTGVATVEMDNGKKENFESTDPVMQGFESRIDNIQKNIEKLKAGKLAHLEADEQKENRVLSTNEELELRKELKD